MLCRGVKWESKELVGWLKSDGHATFPHSFSIPHFLLLLLLAAFSSFPNFFFLFFLFFFFHHLLDLELQEVRVSASSRLLLLWDSINRQVSFLLFSYFCKSISVL